MNGGALADQVFGGEGNDTITVGSNAAVAGADTIFGGAGNDTLNVDLSNAGDDTIVIGDFGTGTNVLNVTTEGASASAFTVAGGGTSPVITTATNETVTLANFTGQLTATNLVVSNGTRLLGNWNGAQATLTGSTVAGGDQIIAGANGDTLVGNAGTDLLTGGAGNDIFYNGTTTNTADDGSADTMNGGAGDDTFYIEAGDSVIGGAGQDTANINTAGTIDLDGTPGAAGDLQSVETINADDGSVVITSQTDYALSSGTTLTVNGSGLAAGQTLTFTGAAYASTINVSVTGGVAADTLTGGNGIDTISGGTGADSLVGGAGNDSITGGETADTITGGTGADTIILTESASTADKAIYTTVNDGATAGTFTTGYDVITGFISGTDKISITSASALDTALDDTAANNTIGWISNAAFDTSANEALLSTGGGITNADLTTAGLVNVLARLNGFGITSANTEDALVAVQGASQTAFYVFIENAGTTNNIESAELTLLGTVDTLLSTSDFEIA